MSHHGSHCFSTEKERCLPPGATTEAEVKKPAVSFFCFSGNCSLSTFSGDTVLAYITSLGLRFPVSSLAPSLDGDKSGEQKVPFLGSHRAFSRDGPPSFLCANILTHAPRGLLYVYRNTPSSLPLQMGFLFYLPHPSSQTGSILAHFIVPLEPSTPLGSQRTELCLHRAHRVDTTHWLCKKREEYNNTHFSSDKLQLVLKSTSTSRPGRLQVQTSTEFLARPGL